jgi:hypothetical protein
MFREENAMSHKIFRFYFVLILVIGLVTVTTPQPAYAAGPWYVAPTGDDNNDCLSPATPCATVNGAIGKASAGDTVYVAEGTYTGSGTEVVLIDRDITLLGGWDANFTTQSGMSTLNGQDAQRGLTVNGGLTAMVERFALQHGMITGNGGGINNAGNLTFVNGMINNNTAGNGNGSGIFNADTGVLVVSNSIVQHNGSDEQCWTIVNNGMLTLDNSVVEENISSTKYCARFTVFNVSGTTTITQTTIRNNVGGVYNYATLTLNNSTISGNIGSDGPGGIYNWGGTLVVNNSTISSNSTSTGGGIFAGGGGSVRLNNDTISRNTASTGGGIYNSPNSPAEIIMQNTILAGNTASGASPDCSGSLGSAGYNLVGDISACDFQTNTGDLTNVDAKLGSLIGTPGYHSLASDSPAVDAGNPAGCTDQDGNPLATDQRGAARVGICDIGAYEYTTPGPVANLIILSGDAQHSITTVPFSKPFQVAAVDSQGSPAEGVTIDFAAPDSGPSGTFADTGTNTTSAVSDASGVATTSIFTANDQAGSYLVSASAPGAGSVDFNLEQVDRPANDNFASAEVIASLPFNDSVDGTNATKEPGEPSNCGNGPNGQSLWYSFTPATSMVISADTAGSGFISPNLTIFQSTGPGFEGLAFVRNGCFGQSLTFNAQAGTTYYIQAEWVSSGAVTLHLNLQAIPAPANDNFADAELIGALPFSATVDNTGATLEPNEPQGCDFAFRSVWYAFTPSENMAVRLDMEGSSIGGVTSIFVASGPGISDLTFLRCVYSPTNIQVEGGQTYYLRVDSFGQPGTIQVNLQQIFPPANDNFANAESINSLPFSATVDNTDATLEVGEPQGCNTSFRSAWYSFTPSENMSVRMDMNSPVGAFADLFLASGPGISDLTSLACAFSGDPTNFQVEGGQTYYLRVDSFGQGGAIQINLEQIFPPANDNFVNAEVIASLPFSVSVDNTDATLEANEPQACNSSFRSVWYAFTPAENMAVRMDMAGSAVSAHAGLFLASGPSISDLTPLACVFSGSSTNFQVEAGKIYYIQVDSFRPAGAMQFNLEQIFPPTNDNFANAETINSLPFHATVDNADALFEPDEPSGCGFSYQSLWYSFTPAENMAVRMNTVGSVAPGNVSIYLASGPSITDLTFLTCASGSNSTKLQLEAGQTYYLQVDSYGQGGIIQVNLEQLNPPGNDNFASPEVVTGLPFSTTVDVTDATHEPDEPQYCYGMDATVWYSFTPTETMLLRANALGSSVAGNVNIYSSSGAGFAGLQFLNCSGPTGSPSFLAEAGQTYYLQVGSAFGESGTVNVNLKPAIAPANDNLVDAAAIPSLPFSGTIDITDATIEPDEPQFCAFMPNTVWYSFTPVETTKFQVDTQTSPIRANVNVYHASGPGFADLQFLECSGGAPAIFPAEAGQTYMIQAGGTGEAGSIQFNLNQVFSITGRVVDAVTGAPLPGDVEPYTTAHLYRICGDGCLDFVNSQNTDAEGRFVFDSYYYGSPLSAGSYQIVVTALLHESQQFGPFEFGSSNLDVGDLRLIPPSMIRGRAMASDTGSPLSGANVILRRCDSSGCSEFVNSQTTDSNGQFLFNSFSSGAPLSGGTYELEISTLLYQTRHIAVTVGDGEDRDLGDVSIDPSPLIGSISGRLIDAVTGQPIAQTFTPSLILYRCEADVCSFANSTIPDAAGFFRFETDYSGNRLIAGSYRLEAYADQYFYTQTGIFDVGENVAQNVGNVRLNSLPVRFSEVQPCADIPASGGECVFTVRVFNGTSKSLAGKVWSLANGSLPDTFAGYTNFQIKDPQDLNLGKGKSKVFSFRFTVPATTSTYGTYICTRLFVGQGSQALFNTIGVRDLFCVYRNAGGFAVASAEQVMASAQASGSVAATATEIEPNNSCQTAQDAGALVNPFVLDGNLDSSSPSDIDFFRLTGTPGSIITIDHEGSANGQGTLENPLLGVFDSNCNLTTFNDDSGSSNSHLEINVPDDGIFVVAATAYPDFGFTGVGSGSYRLTVTPPQFIGSIAGVLTDSLNGKPLRGDATPFAFVRLLRCDTFGCSDVNSQNTASDGSFHFATDFNGNPLRVGNYMLVAFADQYQYRQTEMFPVGEGEAYDAGRVALDSYPIRLSDTQVCSVPAKGGVCDFSVKITNGLARKFSGKAWSIITGDNIGSFTNYTSFQTAAPLDVSLAPGKSTFLRFRFTVRGSVPDGAYICANVLAGENPNPFFHTLGQRFLFCFTKGPNGFTLMSEQEMQSQLQHMPLLEVAPNPVPSLPKK